MWGNFKNWIRRSTLIFTAVLILEAAPCLAGDSGGGRTLYLGVGAIARDMSKVATSATTVSKPLLGDPYLIFTVMAHFRLGQRWSLSPDFRYAYPYKITPDGHATSTVYGGGLRLLYHLSDAFDFHVGPGVQFYQIMGSGGFVSLKNGAGTATFAAPDGISTSRILYLDSGVGLSLGRFRLDVMVLLSNLLSSSRRSVSSVVNLSLGVF